MRGRWELLPPLPSPLVIVTCSILVHLSSLFSLHSQVPGIDRFNTLNGLYNTAIQLTPYIQFVHYLLLQYTFIVHRSSSHLYSAMDQWTNGPMDQWTNGSIGYQAHFLGTLHPLRRLLIHPHHTYSDLSMRFFQANQLDRIRVRHDPTYQLQHRR